MLFKLGDVKKEEQNNSDGGSAIAGETHSFPSSGKLEETLELVKINSCVHWVSDGDWSMHDLLIGLLSVTGRADVYLSSYAFSEYPARLIADHVERKIIKSLFCLIDKRLDVRSASALAIIKNIATRLELVNTHAKVTVIEGELMTLTVIGSANYTTNKRYERGIIIEGAAAAAFDKNWMLNAFKKIK